MAFERFHGSISVPTERERVWTKLLDVSDVASWISVLSEIREIEPLSRYHALLQDRLGPFKLRADLDIEITDVEEQSKLRARASGQDRQLASHIQVEATLLLDETQEGTNVEVDGSYEVTGKTATLGASSIRKKANVIIEEFFASIETRCQ